MRRNGYLWTSGVNLDTAVPFTDPDFLLRVQNFSDLATFSVDFCIFVCWMSAIFLLPVCLTYWPRKYTTRFDPTSIIPARFEVDMTIDSQVIAFLSADTSRDLATLTFDLLNLNLSSDQLRAASLIGRNAVTWLCALSTVRRSSWHVIEYLQHVTRFRVTCRHMSHGSGWHVVKILRKWSHKFDSRPITKSNVIFCTLFLFTFCFVFVGLSY